MDLWAAALWGLAGGLCVEALELYGSIKSAEGGWSWRRPIPQGFAAYVVSVVIRVGIGGIVAAAAVGAHQVEGSLAALGLGVSAPLVIERLARAVPLVSEAQVVASTTGQPATAAARTPSARSGNTEDQTELVLGQGGEDAL